MVMQCRVNKVRSLATNMVYITGHYWLIDKRNSLRLKWDELGL